MLVYSFAAPVLQVKHCFELTVFVCETLWTVLFQADLMPVPSSTDLARALKLEVEA